MLNDKLPIIVVNKCNVISVSYDIVINKSKINKDYVFLSPAM